MVWHSSLAKLQVSQTEFKLLWLHTLSKLFCVATECFIYSISFMKLKQTNLIEFGKSSCKKDLCFQLDILDRIHAKMLRWHDEFELHLI